MILGLSLAQFTVLHVAISMVAIFAGFVVAGGLFSNTALAGWTAFFLLMTILTNITGFLFPFGGFTPAIAVGALSSLILVVALLALYFRRLAGRWRAIYIVTALAGLYLNVFVMIAQSFQKVSFLTPLAPTGSEPPFLIAQAIALVAFVGMGAWALLSFDPRRAMAV